MHHAPPSFWGNWCGQSSRPNSAIRNWGERLHLQINQRRRQWSMFRCASHYSLAGKLRRGWKEVKDLNLKCNHFKPLFLLQNLQIFPKPLRNGRLGADSERTNRLLRRKLRLSGDNERRNLENECKVGWSGRKTCGIYMMRLLQKSLKVPGKMGGQINELKSHSKRENTRIYGVSAGTARELPTIRPCTRQIERRAHRLLALWPPPCSIIVKFFKLQNESGSAPLPMAEEGTHLARKSHSIGPLRSTAHPPQKKNEEENTQRSARS